MKKDRIVPDSVDWWNMRVRSCGRTPAAADYSEWTTVRRFAAVGRWICGRGRVADICGGVGLLRSHVPSISYYSLYDWSEEAVALAVADRKRVVKVPDDLGVVCDDLDEDKIDWAVVVGAFVLDCLFDEWENVVRRLLGSVRCGVIANFAAANADHEHEDYLRPVMPSHICRAVEDLRPTIDQSYLPHEFMVVVHRREFSWFD